MSEPEKKQSRAKAPLTERRFLRVQDAADYLSLSERKVWELIKEGAITARKIDGCTLIERSALDAF